MRKTQFWIVLLATGIGLTGCFKCPEPTLRQEERGLVCVFPGIGGGAWYLNQVYQAYRDAGVDSAIVIPEWPTPFYTAMKHLQDYEANRTHAARIAQQIVAYRQREPKPPIDLVGYSAGGGIAVMVAEALPEDIHLRNIVLVQSAVSPKYDLDALLRRVDGHLVNLYSPLDWFVLGWGTNTFGTVARAHTESAGKIGFDLPRAAADETLRAKVVQHGWTANMIWAGHLGNHASILGYFWNRKYVAPYLLPDGAAPACAHGRVSSSTSASVSR